MPVFDIEPNQNPQAYGVMTFGVEGVTPPGLQVDSSGVLTLGGVTLNGGVSTMPAVSVFRSGTELLVRSTFDATRDILMPFTTSGGEESAVHLATDTNLRVTLVPSATADSLIWPTISVGDTIHATYDDNCPINVGSWSYVGGNHGYSTMSIVTMTNHGKTTVDDGSTWSDGTRTYTLLAVIDANNLLFGHPYTTSGGVSTASTFAPAATLTHVAGATHTANITITGGVAGTQLHPCTWGHSVSVALDGRPVDDGKSAGQVFEITETYLVVSYKGLIDAAQANIGTPVTTLIAAGSVSSLCRISNTYKVSGPTVIVSQRVTATEKFVINMGVTQTLALSAPAAGSVRQFMGGVGTVGGIDFTTYADLSAMVSDIDIAPANYLSASVPSTTMSQWAYDSGGTPQYGLAMGYLPLQDGHPFVRGVNAVTKSWMIVNSTKKNYPQLAWAKTINIGESLSGTAYRRYLATQNTEIFVSNGTETYVVIERPTTASDVRMIAPELLGCRLTPIAAPTVLVEDRVSGDGIGYSVPSAPGYGMWRAAPEPPRLESIPGSTGPVGTYFLLQYAATTQQALTGGYQILYLYPMYLPEPTAIDRVAAEVTVLGTGVLRHGIYLNNPATGMPVLTGPLADFGTLDVTGTGIKETTLGTALVLPSGWHFYGQCWQVTNTTAPTMRVSSTASGFGPLNIGTSNVSMSAGRYGFYMNGCTGAFGTLTLTGPHGLLPPRIVYRRA